MKHFIVELTYSGSPEAIAAGRPAHRAYLQEAFAKGMFLFSGPQVGAQGGIFVARAATLEELQAFCAGDPFATGGIATHRYIEFNPVLRQEWMTNWIEGK
ncbi:MAG TPA: YciI family protein [Candidatus Methylacidiphilales bacterium]